MDGQAEMRVQIVGEGAHLFRLRAFGSAQAQGQANHDLTDFILRQHLAKGFQIAALVLTLDGVQALRGDAERIGDGHANAFRADIEGQDSFVAGVPGAGMV